MPITCKCGNDTFRLLWNGRTIIICTRCSHEHTPYEQER